MASQNGSVESALKKDVGLLTALTLVVGMVLGAGAFMKPPAVLGITGDTNAAVLAWVLGAILSMCGGLTMAELGVLFPRTGGVYVFLEEMYGSKLSYLYGWMMIFLYGPATVAALSGYFSSVFCLLFDIPEHLIPVIAFTIMAFVVFINTVGVRQAGYLQKIATFCKLIPIVAIAVFGLWKGNGQVFGMGTGIGATAPFSIAMISVLFAYDGWAQVASVAGEMKQPGRILPLAIIGGIVFLSFVYTAINLALFKVLPPDQIVSLGHDASSIAAQKLFGLYGGNMISVGIMISIIGGINGYIMTLSRVILAMSERRQMPGSSVFVRLEEDSKTPVNAQILLLVLSFVYFTVVDTERLTNITMFSIWIFYVFCFWGVIRTRRRLPDAPRSYRVPLYPVVPLLAIAGALYVIYGMFVSQPLNAVFAVGLILIGLPVLHFFCGDRPFYQSLSFRKRNLFLIASLIMIGMLFMFSKVFDNRPVLVVATENSNRPVAFTGPTGEPAGFAIDLITAMAEKAGYKVQFRPIAFEHLFNAVNNKSVDVATGILTINEQRQGLVAFTNSYGGSELALLVRSDSPARSLADLDGQRIVVRKGTVAEQFLAGKTEFEVLSIDDPASALSLYQEGGADAMVEDTVLLSLWLDENKLAGRLIPLGVRERYAFAYNKGNVSLGEALNGALEELQNSGEIDKLCKKWNIRLEK